MPTPDRRSMLRTSLALAAFPGTAVVQLGCGPGAERGSRGTDSSSADDVSEDGSKAQASGDEKAMKIQYLEIVTPEVEAVCKVYSQIHGVTFGEPDPSLGGARTAKLANGGLLGVRGPLRETEEPVVRPYVLVEDIEAALAAAEDSGGEIAVPPMALPGHGTCAIFFQGGIECGLWQL